MTLADLIWGEEGRGTIETSYQQKNDAQENSQ